MNDNPYQTPKAKLISNEKVKGSPVKAIVTAAIVDIVGTLILGIIIAVGYSIYHGSKGMPPEEISRSLENLDVFSTTALVSIFLGCLITIYASNLCAKIVNYSEYKFVSIYVLLTVIVSFLMDMRVERVGETIGLSFLALACAYYGTWLHVKNKQIN